MTHTISLSELRAAGIEDVHEAVTSYAEAVRRWTEHHERVQSDALRPQAPEPIPGDFLENQAFETAYQQWAREAEERHQAYPMDQHHPAIMAAIRVDGGTVRPDYELVDDTPSPEAVLRSKKDALLGTILQEETRRKEAVSPPGRTRFMMLQLRGVQKRDQDRMSEYLEGLNLAGLKVGSAEQKDALRRSVDYKVDHGRTPEDQRLMDTFEDLQAQQARVDDRAAELMGEVEDLTSSNVDSWKLTWGDE